MSNKPVVVEITYNVAVEKVWNAITVNDEMKKWYFDIASFKPEIGFEFEFTGGNENKIFLHLCKVTEVVPGKKLVYSWRYDGFDGISYVHFELSDLDDQTRLVLTHTGLESFPPVPDFAKDNFVAGWNYILGTSLKNYLEAK